MKQKKIMALKVAQGKGVCIICNEECKLLGLAGNGRLSVDIITGVLYVRIVGANVLNT